MNPEMYDECERLAAACLDHTATPEEVARFNELLHTDSSYADLYVEQSRVHAELLFDAMRKNDELLALPNPGWVRMRRRGFVAVAASLAVLLAGGTAAYYGAARLAASVPGQGNDTQAAGSFPAAARQPKRDQFAGGGSARTGKRLPAASVASASSPEDGAQEAGSHFPVDAAARHPMGSDIPNVSSVTPVVQAQNSNKEQGENMNATNRILVATLAATTLQSFADDINIGYRENGILSVPAGITTNYTGTAVISEGVLNKLGDGTLVLSSSNLIGQSGGKIVVRQGTLQLTPSDALPAKAVRPDSILQHAAFWLDANTNVLSFASNDTTYVTQWLDVREPSTNAPYQYVRAVSQSNYTNILPELVSTNSDAGAIPAVFFGYDTSGRWMQWTKTDGTLCDLTGICHVFLARGIFKSLGFVLGGATWPPDFHAGIYGIISIYGNYWAQNSWEPIALYRGRTYLNGEYVDGSTNAVRTGWQLLEVALGENTAHASDFFNDRNLWNPYKRVGGDYLCEAVIFTNRLAEADRLSVQRYLMEKWRGIATSNGMEIVVGDAGTVQFPVPDVVVTNDAFSFSGKGILEKTGEGTLIIPDSPNTAVFDGQTVVTEGAMDSRVPMPVQVKAGRKVTAADTVLRFAAAPAGTFVKDGTGTVTVSSFPSSVSALQLKAGVLVMKRPLDQETIVTNIYGTLPDPSFEETQLTTASGYKFSNGVTYNGWTCVDPGLTSQSYALIYNRTNYLAGHGSEYWWPCPYLPPDGKQCLCLKWDAGVFTTLTLPTNGVYDITFFTSGRDSTLPLLVDFCMVDGEATNRFATVSVFAWPWYQQRVRTPWLTAGDHTLYLRSFQSNVDATGAFDDFKVTLVTTKKSDGTIPLKNGDFERTNYAIGKDSSNFGWPLCFATNNMAEGWTCCADENGNPLAAPVRFGGSIGETQKRFYKKSSGYGNVALAICSNGAASTFMTLPAGTYQLQADIANWHFRNSQASGGYLTATIMRESGTTESLGTARHIGVDLVATLWPGSFAMTNNETVMLTVQGPALNDSILADNFVAVPLENSELISNGGFESLSSWTMFYSTNVLPATSASITGANVHDGNLVYDGKQLLRLCNQGGASQTVTLPSSGFYRLVMHVSRRHDLPYGDSYGHNPVRAWLAQGSATNLIGWTRDDDIPFVKREFLFRAEAGTYTFGIQGMNDGTSTEFPATNAKDRTALVDGVSLKKVTDFADQDFTLPEKLILTVDKGARLQLDYTCTNKVADIYLGGKRVSGVIDQKSYPAFVTGPGALYTSRKGTVIMLM